MILEQEQDQHNPRQVMHQRDVSASKTKKPYSLSFRRRRNHTRSSAKQITPLCCITGVIPWFLGMT
ncbi:MAG: hypothetical protein ABI850_03710, partial [Flavobacterium sp.]